MLKNPNYVYGPKGLTVPANLNFGDYILEKLWQYKDRIALINGETNESLSYQSIAQQAMNFAISLSRIGIGKGQTVAIFSENRQEYWSAAVGVVCTGAVLTTINTGYTKDELKHITNISKPTCVICSPMVMKIHEKTLRTIECIKTYIIFGTDKQYNSLLYNDLAINVINNVKYEEFQAVDVKGQSDTLFVLYSSGTTGLPKGVMLTHLNVIAACALPASQDPADLALMITPWYHVMGFVGSFTTFALGRTGVFLPKFNVDLYLKTIEKYKIVNLSVVPPVLVAVCKSQSQYDVSSVKMIHSGAAPLHRDTVKAANEVFPNVKEVLQGYGATEMTLAVSKFNFIDRNVSKPGSVGKVIAGTVLKIVDVETQKPLGPKQQGEIYAKGPLMMKGYIGKNSSEDFDEEGFYKTGDVGYYDEDDYLFVVDRLKELIKYNGYQVPPAELEAVLLQHESVRDVGVVGIDDKDAGEVPLAFVVIQPGKAVSEQELKDFVAKRLSNPKHLRGGVRFIKQIPKSPSGKILRKELRKMVNNTRSKL